MKDELRLTILGCGSSPGVPRVTGDWGACDPTEPRNRRRRCAALVERIGAYGRTAVAIDCGPDFREQMLGAGIDRLDAVVLTHAHADHIHGLDDIRSFVIDMKRRMPVHADEATSVRLLEAFRYCFETPKDSTYPPIAHLIAIAAGEPFRISGAGGPIEFRPFRQVHGRIHSLGFRIGGFAYCSDVSDFPEAAQAEIAGADHLVVDALQYKPHPNHLSLDEALVWIERFGVPSAVLTHMHTPLDYRTLCDALPAHIRPAYDGLRLSLPA